MFGFLLIMALLVQCVFITFKINICDLYLSFCCCFYCMSNNEKCSVCYRKVSSTSQFHLCKVCKKWSHAKCNGIVSKYLSNFWICVTCKNEAFPFYGSNVSDVIKLDSGVSNFKSYFQQLNNLVDPFIHSSTPEGFENVNCKFYDCFEFLSIPQKVKMFSCMHINISSLCKHFDELSELLSALNHNFSVLGISETRLSNMRISNIDIPNYAFIHTPPDSSVGGVGLYIHNRYAFKPRPDLNQLLFCSKLLESVFVEIIFKSKVNVVVGCIYKHPLLDTDIFNNNYLSLFLQKASKENKTLVLLGDFNINLLNCTTSSSINNFLDLLGSYQLMPQITLPTRITEQSSTLIDNIFLSSNQYQCLSGNLSVKLSDHLPQFILINLYEHLKKQKFVGKQRDWSQFNEEDFILDYLDVNWKRILNIESSNASVAFESFFNALLSLVDKHAPFVQLSKKQMKLRSKPWITKDILVSIRVRDRLFKSFIKSKNEIERVNLYSQYKAYRNRIVSLCNLSKRKFYSNYFYANSKNIKNIWKGIRDLISSGTLNNTPISLQNENSVTSDPGIVSEIFNNYFVNIANKIKAKIPFTRHNFQSYLKNPNPNSFFVNPTNPTEVSLLIDSLKNNKACGPNSIPVSILKLINFDISITLSKLVNLSFSSGIFPTILKEAQVIPIFKKGSTLEVHNYRPISLLSNIDKIYQRLMYKRIINFLNVNNCLYSLQFGFRKSYSASDAIINNIETVLKSLDAGDFVCGIFIDLQKAFDTVDHNTLLSKLKHYGIRGVPFNWFKSFLFSRTQYVTISGHKSSVKKISNGVPQGSVLGPLLFLLYINDLNNAIHYSTISHFADDTSLFHSNKSLKSMTKKVNLDLKSLCHWLSANKISLNADKTEFILFRHKRKVINFEVKLKLNGKRLIQSSVINFLGVFVDENLLWWKQVEFISNKLRKANGALCKLRHYVSKNVLMSVYYAIFHSHMAYACQVWGQKESGLTNRIAILQKRAVRIISFSDYIAPSKPIFLALKILSFFDYVKFCNVIFIHKLINNKKPISMSDTFNLRFNTNTYNPIRIKSFLLKLPVTKTVSYGTYSIHCQAVSDWNNVQQELSNINISALTLNRIKYLTKFVFFSSYSDFNM